jgi:hypothetical protein
VNLTQKEMAIIAAIDEWAILINFPEDELKRSQIMKLLDRLANNADEITWLTNELVLRFDKWPGPHTLRAVFCQRYQPRDGNVVDLPESHPIVQAAMQRAIDECERYKQLPPAAHRQIRELMAPRLERDVRFEAQSARWFDACKSHKIDKIYTKLSNEFATADLDRREAILAQIESEIAHCRAAGAKQNLPE